MKLRQIILCSAFLIPLQEKDKWEDLKFSKINPHKLEFSKSGMKINVNSSAMPLIYPFKKVIKIKEVSIEGERKGKLNLNPKLKQGAKKNDDFALKFGLVIPGDKTLPFYKRAFAPQWIKRLFDLAPKDMGVDHISFINAVEDPKLKGESRIHPLGDGLIKENNVWILNKEGKFNFTYKFNPPVSAAAIWLAIDGDDTKSKYEMILNKIELIQ